MTIRTRSIQAPAYMYNNARELVVMTTTGKENIKIMKSNYIG